MQFSYKGEIERLYFTTNNNGMQFLNTLATYNKELASFETTYAKINPIIDYSIPSNIIDNIFSDLGY